MFAPTNIIVIVHGNQKATVSKDSIEIINLNAGSMTRVDTVKETYAVTMMFGNQPGAGAAMQHLQGSVSDGSDEPVVREMSRAGARTTAQGNPGPRLHFFQSAPQARRFYANEFFFRPHLPCLHAVNGINKAIPFRE